MDMPIFIVIMIVLGLISFFFICHLIMTNQKYWERLLGTTAFIFLIFFIISVGEYVGKLTFRGTPLLFKELSNNSKYKIIKIIDDNHMLMKIVADGDERKIDPIFVKDIPKEITSMKEGETFELKNIPSITSGGHIIAPMLHPH